MTSFSHCKRSAFLFINAFFKPICSWLFGYYLIFFSRDVRALTTALKASSLPGATHLSGCRSTASFLYALLTSSLVAPGFTPSMSQLSLLLRIRRIVSACSLVKPILTSGFGLFPPFSHISVIEEKKGLKHFTDAFATLSRRLKILKTSALCPQPAFTLVYHSPFSQVDLVGTHDKNNALHIGL